MNKDNLSLRIADACNDVRLSDLHRFCNRHFTRQITNRYKKKRTPYCNKHYLVLIWQSYNEIDKLFLQRDTLKFKKRQSFFN